MGKMMGGGWYLVKGGGGALANPRLHFVLWKGEIRDVSLHTVSALLSNSLYYWIDLLRWKQRAFCFTEVYPLFGDTCVKWRPPLFS
jgi:hypothetical protein